jgi:hypothetical protein
VQGKVRKKECEFAGDDDVRKGGRTKTYMSPVGVGESCQKIT